MDEYGVLDAIWEALPEDIAFGASLYKQRGKMTGPEMYITINDECWQITATRHYHPLEGR